MRPLLLALAIGWPAACAAADVTIVRDAEPRAAIVVGARPTPVERLAAEELAWHIERMSGAKLPIGRAAPEGAVPIYIGRAATAVGVDPKGLTLEHYRLETGADWLAIAGRDGSRSERVDDPLEISTVQPGTLFGGTELALKLIEERMNQ